LVNREADPLGQKSPDAFRCSGCADRCQHCGVGFNNPILVDTQAGIIAGHGRLLAARKLGLKEVPVIILDHLTDAQKRAYIIAGNQLALTPDGMMNSLALSSLLCGRRISISL
jgi:hypothetical protein